MNLDRRPWESLASHVERVWLDDLFDGASTSEIAAFCGCEPSLVVKVQRRFERVRGLRLVFEHAEHIREAVDWPFDAAALIHMALERYAERWTERESSKGRETNARGLASGLQGPRQWSEYGG